jgi:hypothetical protein
MSSSKSPVVSTYQPGHMQKQLTLNAIPEED